MLKFRNKIIIPFIFVVTMLLSILMYRNISATTHQEYVKNLTELNSCVAKPFDEVTCILDTTYPDIANSDVINIPANNYATTVKLVGKKDASGNMIPLKFLYTGTSNNHMPHFEINFNSNKTQLLIDELYLYGNVEVDGNGKPLPIDNLLNIGDYQRGGLKLSNSNIRNESFKITNSRFELIKSTPVNISYSADSDVYVENSSFINNHSYAAAGIYMENNPKNVTIKNNYFEGNIGNTNTAGNYDGGVIYIKNGLGTTDITNNYFKNNATYSNVNGATNMGGGGAIGIRYTYSHNTNAFYNIVGNYFEGNEAGSSSNNLTNNLSSYGGAISIRGSSTSVTLNNIKITNNTFNGNKAHYNGGALSIQGIKVTNNIDIINNTFYKNKIENNVNATATQGAGLYYSAVAGKFLITSNTFLDNAVYLNRTSSQKGVDITVASGVTSVFSDNLLSGASSYYNGVKDNNIPKKSISFSTTSFLHNASNLGDDSSSIPYLNRLYTFGSDTPELRDNGGYKVGSTPYEITIPTIRVATYLDNGYNLTKGFAYDNIQFKNGYTISRDQREKYRGTSNYDYGANDFAALIYDANGGNWTFTKKADNASSIIYSGLTPSEYVSTGNFDEAQVVIGGDNLSNGGKIFLGWSTDIDAKIPNILPGSAINFKKEIRIYAVWDNPKILSITYYPNGASNGEVPIDANLYAQGDTATILDKNTLEKSNNLFMYWNTKEDGSGTTYNPGAIFAINGSMKLYAQWSSSADNYDSLMIRQRTPLVSENVIPNEGYANLETIEYIPKMSNILIQDKTYIKPSLGYYNFGSGPSEILNISFHNESIYFSFLTVFLEVKLKDGTILPISMVNSIPSPGNGTTEVAMSLDIPFSNNGLTYNLEDIEELKFTYQPLGVRQVVGQAMAINESSFVVKIDKQITDSQIKYVGYATDDAYYTKLNISKSVYKYKVSNINPMYYNFLGQRISETEIDNNSAPLISVDYIRNSTNNYISIWYESTKDKEEQYYSWSNELKPVK